MDDREFDRQVLRSVESARTDALFWLGARGSGSASHFFARQELKDQLRKRFGALSANLNSTLIQVDSVELIDHSEAGNGHEARRLAGMGMWGLVSLC